MIPAATSTVTLETSTNHRGSRAVCLVRAEPFVFPDRHSNRLAELYRTALEHRINLIVAIHRRWALEGAFRSVDLATLDRITATALSPGLRGRLLRRVLAWMETHDTTVRLLLGRTTRR